MLGASTTLLGFFVDDYVHVLSLEGKVPMTTKFDLFTFASGEPGAIEEVMGFIPFPWYTDLNVKLHFFRPLSCATMALDHALFGRNTVPYHLHSVLWHLAFVAGAWLVLRRALPAHLAGLAIVLFAISFTHIIATMWWSNRNALVAAVPALFGLWAHMRWREDAWRVGLPLSLLGYAIGLLGGETALGLFGFVGAYELFGRRDAYSRRLAALAPGALLGVGYLASYKLGNYGTRGSGVYIDPTGDPLQYLLHAPERILMLIAAQFWLVPVEIPAGNAKALLPLLMLSAAACAVTVWLGIRAWRGLDEHARSGLSWLVPGALLACAPVLSTFASARLLLVPSIGLTPLIAAILLYLCHRPDFRLARPVLATLVLLHVAVSALAWPGLSLLFARVDAVMCATIARSELEGVDPANTVVIVPAAPDPMSALYTVILREYEGRPRYQAWHALSMAQCAHRVTRTAGNRIELELVEGELLESLFEQLMRDVRNGFAPGERITLPGLTVEVLALGRRAPSRIAFEFPGDLDAPPYVFVEWKDDRLAPAPPPRVGESRDIPFDPGIINPRYIARSPAP